MIYQSLSRLRVWGDDLGGCGFRIMVLLGYCLFRGCECVVEGGGAYSKRLVSGFSY